jgi:chemotaxis signal transduction protein
VLWILAEVDQEILAIRGTEVLEVVPAIAPKAIMGSAYPWLGVIRFRGKIVPVMDLAKRMELAGTPDSMRHRILIVQSDDLSPLGLYVPSASTSSDEEFNQESNQSRGKIVRQMTVKEIFSDRYLHAAREMLRGLSE